MVLEQVCGSVQKIRVSRRSFTVSLHWRPGLASYIYITNVPGMGNVGRGWRRWKGSVPGWESGGHCGQADSGWEVDETVGEAGFLDPSPVPRHPVAVTAAWSCATSLGAAVVLTRVRKKVSPLFWAGTAAACNLSIYQCINCLLQWKLGLCCTMIKNYKFSTRKYLWIRANLKEGSFETPLYLSFNIHTGAHTLSFEKRAFRAADKFVLHPCTFF